MVEGGKATPNAQIAQALGPKGINIGEVMSKINEKTASFNGMKIPVTVEIEDNDYTITAGTPPVSELIKKEVKVEKGAGEPNKNKIANIGIEQVIKISKMKQDSILHNNFTSVVKSVVGSCNTLGVLVEGKEARLVCKLIDKGEYKEEIEKQTEEVSDDKIKKLEEQLTNVQARLAKQKEKEEAEEAEAKAKVEEEAAEKATEDGKVEAKPEGGEEAKIDEKAEAKPEEKKEEAKK